MKITECTRPRATYSNQELARTFDQSILRPDDSSTDVIKKTAALAVKHGFRSLVVHPTKVSMVRSLLTGSDVLTVAVSDFPHGREITETRVAAVKNILKQGVDEVDIVSRYERLLEGDAKTFEDDIRAVAKVMNGKILKIILEIDLLNATLIQEATKIIARVAKEDKNTRLVIKTKTGFAENKFSNLEALKLIKMTLDDLGQYAETVSDIGNGKIGIKISGGVRKKEEVVEFLNEGAHIIGIGKGAEVLGL